MKFSMGTCHLEIPTHSFDDIISTDITFHALPSTVAGTNEITDLGFIKQHNHTKLKKGLRPLFILPKKVLDFFLNLKYTM